MPKGSTLLLLLGMLLGANTQANVLVDATLLGSQSAKSLDLTKIELGATSLLPSQSGVRFYRLTYHTPDRTGALVTASGLLILPDASVISIVSYQHGTVFGRLEAPSVSTMSPETMAAAVTLGSMGYGVVAADYLGLGSNIGVHPYLDSVAEAQVSGDMLLAAQEYLAQAGITWNRRLYLVGYSEGAHATMALEKALEENEKKENEQEENPRASLPPILASVAGAGPYDLSGVTLQAALTADSSLWSASTADIIFSMDTIYQIAPSLDAIFLPPYAAKIPSLFDGSDSSMSVVEAMPPRLGDFVQPAFVQDLENNPQNPLKRALAANNLYDWTPKAPVLFLHASGDTRVPFANSTLIFNTMKARGAQVTLVDLGSKLDHDDAFIPAMLGAEQFISNFETTLTQKPVK